jgi:tetrapyrrole methylase family protein / MazG family protein
MVSAFSVFPGRLFGLFRWIARDIEKLMSSREDKKQELAEAFWEFGEIIHQLRAPGGCPWDRKQTPQSLKQYIIEEAYEVLDAIDAGEPGELLEELGDLLLQVGLQSEIAEENGDFDLAGVARGISRKLVRRHPHVFGDVSAETAEDVLTNWEQLKKREKQDRGLLDGLPRTLPALQQAVRMGEKAARIGFDWPSIEGVREKVDEELGELDEAIELGDESAMTHELGDVLFAVSQHARHLGLSPEECLKLSCQRFADRFGRLEEAAKKRGERLEDMALDRMETYWQEAKKK